MQGQYVGTYVGAACSDDGFLAATCLGQAGRFGEARLNLSQAQAAMSGSIELAGGPIETSEGSLSNTSNVTLVFVAGPARAIMRHFAWRWLLAIAA